MNPNETGTGLTLNISEQDNALDLDLAMEVAAYFRVNEAKANSIRKTVQEAVNQWQKVANLYKISRQEQGVMGTAFLVD